MLFTAIKSCQRWRQLEKAGKAEVWSKFWSILVSSLRYHFQSNLSTVGKFLSSFHLFSAGPTSSIQPMKDGSIGIEKSKVFDVDTKTESQLFEFDLFFELVLLEILNM